MKLSVDRRTAISEAYDKHADQLYRLAISQLQNMEDAQDAVHDVFLKYCSTQTVFNSAEHEHAWLLKVTVNKCRDILRRKKIRSYITFDDVEEILPEISPKDADSVLDLMNTLRKLPEKLRIVIILHELEGFSICEIASSLGLSESAIKMRLSRAKMKLKDLLETEEKYV